MKKNYFETIFEMIAKCLRALIFCNKNLLEIDFLNEKKFFENFFEMFAKCLRTLIYCNKNLLEIDFF
jgi:hypothetical protein